MDAAKVEVWVCAQCGAKHWPQVVVAHGGCPSCHHPQGKVVKMTDAERNAAG